MLLCVMIGRSGQCRTNQRQSYCPFHSNRSRLRV